MTALTQTRLVELLVYDEQTGVFTWRVARPACKLGGVAGSTKLGGYRRIGIDNHMYLAHRLAWLYVTGAWPIHGIDHRDGNPGNNAFCNLREATLGENAQNLKKRDVPFTGVSAKRGKWQAQINADGKYIYLGLFDTPELAHQAYLEAKAKLHKFQPVPRDLCT